MRKFIVILLTVLLTIPQVTFAKEMDQELKEVILKVKNIIEVPKELTQFNYDVTTEGEDEEKYYAMQWYDEKNEIGRVDVQADVEGNIVNYYTNDFKDTEKEAIKVSYDEGLVTAKNFVNKVIKNEIGEIREGRYVKPTQGNTYTYIFDEYVNGVKVYQRSAYVDVSKASGEVVHFSGFEPFKGTYEKKGKVISLEEAQKAYLEKIGLKLLYKIDQDYKTKTMRTFPAYVTDNLNNKGINAVTGEVTEAFDDEYKRVGTAAKEDSAMTMDAGIGDRLTVEEEKAVKETNGLITSEEAVAKAAKYFPNMAYVTVNNAYLSKDMYNGRYEWSIQLSSVDKEQVGAVPLEKLRLMMAAGETTQLPEGSVAYVGIGVDAKTGEVLRYSTYSAEDDKEKGITYEASRNKVESFLQTIAPHKYKEVKANVQLGTEKENEGRYHRFSYDRIVNGIPVDTNGLYVTYDSVKQEVVSYSNIWNTLKFQDVDQTIAKEEIIKKLGLELVYIPKDKNTRILAYITPDNTITFDAFTGNRINGYDGKPYIDENIKVTYDDIAGHEMESIIKKLYDRGIQLEGKSFKPNSKITQIDFMRMLMGQTSVDRTDEMVYDYAIRQGILSKEEVQKDKQVTALEATKYIIHKLGYKEVAQLKGIYVLPFAEDLVITEEAKGYVALAYGLGIIDSEDLKSVAENTTVSRAQSAGMIYQMLIK